MGTNHVERLNRAQREVLRLYHRRLSTKEIAAELGISPNTASRYLTDAARALEVNRAAASALLTDYERTHPEARGRFSVGDDTPLAPPPAVLVEAIAGQSNGSDWTRFPLRRGATNNELAPLARLFWVFVIPVALTFALGGLGFFLDAVSRIVRALG